MNSAYSKTMDKARALKSAKEFAAVVTEKFSGVRVYLFGSYAKGTFNENSDIDIAVVFEDFDNLLEIQLELMRLRRKIDNRIEPHPFRECDFDRNNPVVNEILEYGEQIRKVA